MTTLKPGCRQNIISRKPLMAGVVSIPHPDVVELMGIAGVELLLIEAEHAAVGRNDLYNMLRAADVTTTHALVRVPRPTSFDWIGLALDAGASGVLVPRIETPDEISAVVAAAKYPPQGTRGNGPCRVNGFGFSIQSEFIEANEKTVIAVMIETRQAFDRIDEIVSAPGLDMVAVGPNDLSIALGIEPFSPEFDEALATVAAACDRHGIRCATFVGSREHVDRAKSLGVTVWFGISDIFMLQRGVKEILQTYNNN